MNKFCFTLFFQSLSAYGTVQDIENETMWKIDKGCVIMELKYGGDGDER